VQPLENCTYILIDIIVQYSLPSARGSDKTGGPILDKHNTMAFHDHDITTTGCVVLSLLLLLLKSTNTPTADATIKLHRDSNSDRDRDSDMHMHPTLYYFSYAIRSIRCPYSVDSIPQTGVTCACVKKPSVLHTEQYGIVTLHAAFVIMPEACSPGAKQQVCTS
jgi:hypothetical protein